MSRKPIITIIGAASTTFGPKVLRDILNHPEVGGSTLRFVDTNDHRLAIYVKLAERINKFLKEPITIESSTERRAMLPDSDYVLVSVDTGHYRTWSLDFSIPVKHGIKQIKGELGGPGGLFHSLRQIPLHLEIGRDIEELCPNAMVQVMSNPLNRICLALERYTNVGQIVGLCHGTEIMPHLYLHKVMDIDPDDVEFTAAGTNHIPWVLDIRRKSTGEDLYPAMRETLLSIDSPEQGMTRKMLEIFGYFSGILDGHFGEYVPFAAEYVGLEGPKFDGMLEQEEKRWEYLGAVANDEAEWDQYEKYYGGQNIMSEELRLTDFFKPRSWADTLAFPIIAAIEGNYLHRMPVINLINTGQIENLPRDIFVETPGIVDASGVRPIHIGELPKALAAFNMRDIDQMEMTVEAAVTGDRNLVLQAMLLDPVVDSIRNAEIVLDEMMKAHAEYLPQFA